MMYTDFPSLIASVERGDAPALSFYVGRERARTLTYRELFEAVDGVAGVLAARGIARGDRVALLAANRLEVPVLLLALMRLGAAAVPLNPTSPPDDWTYILGHSRAKGCFVTADLAGKLGPGAWWVSAVEGILDAPPGGVPEVPSLADDLAVVLYTSGTTGRPKGVGLPQRALLANAWSMAQNFGLAGTTQLAVLPLYHAHAFGFGLMSALTTRGHLVFVEKFDPFTWAEVIRSADVTVTSVVPTLLPPLLKVKLASPQVPALRCILVSSAPLSTDLARDFEGKTGIPLVQGWGLSEYTNFACCMPPDEPGDALRDELMFAREVPSVGCPLPGTEVRVVDVATGAEVGPEVRGELCIRGHSTMLGYLEDADATAKTIDGDRWLHSGDEGYFVERAGTRWFFISGRIKEIIIRGGDKHSPIALERALLASLPELAGHLCVLGFRHDMHGEEIGAYVERDAAAAAGPDVRARLAAAIQAMVAEQRPKIVLFGDAAIPRTHTGKVQRRKLQHLFEPHATCRGATKLLDV